VKDSKVSRKDNIILPRISLISKSARVCDYDDNGESYGVSLSDVELEMIWRGYRDGTPSRRSSDFNRRNARDVSDDSRHYFNMFKAPCLQDIDAAGFGVTINDLE
jgi:hypothetical protein